MGKKCWRARIKGVDMRYEPPDYFTKYSPVFFDKQELIKWINKWVRKWEKYFYIYQIYILTGNCEEFHRGAYKFEEEYGEPYIPE